MITLIFIFILGFLFFFLNECEDESVRNNWKGRWAFLNQKGSWKRKWLIVDNETVQYIPEFRLLRIPFIKRYFKFPVHWWYFGIYPKNVERFTFSSTIFSAVTDPEHSFQFIKLRMIEIAFLIVNWKLALTWWIGTRLFAIIKEKWLPSIS
jgi:hypothetical protein